MRIKKYTDDGLVYVSPPSSKVPLALAQWHMRHRSILSFSNPGETGKFQRGSHSCCHFFPIYPYSMTYSLQIR